MVAEEPQAAVYIPEVPPASVWRMHKVRGDWEARQVPGVWFWYILKIESIDFAAGLDMGCYEKKSQRWLWDFLGEPWKNEMMTINKRRKKKEREREDRDGETSSSDLGILSLGAQ